MRTNLLPGIKTLSAALQRRRRRQRRRRQIAVEDVVSEKQKEKANEQAEQLKDDGFEFDQGKDSLVSQIGIVQRRMRMWWARRYLLLDDALCRVPSFEIDFKCPNWFEV